MTYAAISVALLKFIRVAASARTAILALATANTALTASTLLISWPLAATAAFVTAIGTLASAYRDIGRDQRQLKEDADAYADSLKEMTDAQLQQSRVLNEIGRAENLRDQARLQAELTRLQNEYNNAIASGSPSAIHLANEIKSIEDKIELRQTEIVEINKTNEVIEKQRQLIIDNAKAAEDKLEVERKTKEEIKAQNKLLRDRAAIQREVVRASRFDETDRERILREGAARENELLRTGADDSFRIQNYETTYAKLKELDEKATEDAAKEAFKRTQRDLQERYKRIDIAKNVNRQILADEKKAYDAQSGYIDSFKDRVLDVNEQIQRSTIRIWQNAENAIVQFSRTSRLSFSNLINGFLEDMLRLKLRQNILEPLSGGLQSFISNLFGGGSNVSAGVNHAGLFPNQHAFRKRNVPSHAFDFAPRLHSGFAPDEFPAILQKGETVFPKGFTGFGAPKQTVNIINRSSAVITQRKGRSLNPQEEIIDIFVDNAASGGRALQAVKQGISAGF